MADTPTIQTEAEPKRLTVGEQLAQARRQHELSIEQVAAQLKWSARQIAEIEAGNYSVFPDMLTVRGFVRSYAKFLKVDSTPLVGELSGEFERLPPKVMDRPKLETPFPSGNLPWRHSRNPHGAMAVALVLCLFLLAAFLYRAELLGMVRQWLPAKQEVPVAAEVTPVTSAVDHQSDQPDLSHQAERASSSEAPAAVLPATTVASQDQASLPSPVAPDTVTAVPPKVDAPLAAQHPAVQPAPVPQPANQQPNQSSLKASADGQLVLSFQEDAWVQIKRHDGSIVISHLYRAGDKETVPVDEALNLVIGNAPGVTATLRGQSLILPAQAGSHVANLSIK